MQDRTSGRGQLQTPGTLSAARGVLGSKPAAVVAVTVRGLAIQIQRGDPIGVWVEVFTFGVDKLGALQERRLGEAGLDRCDLQVVPRDAMRIQTELTMSPRERIAIFDPEEVQRSVVANEGIKTLRELTIRPSDNRLWRSQGCNAATGRFIVPA